MKKKIIFVIESLHLGGAEKSLVTLLNNLDYSRYCVDLLLFNKDGIFLEFVPDTVNIIFLNYPKLSFVKRVNFFIKRKTKIRFHHSQLYWDLIKYQFNELKCNYDYAVAYNQGFATYFTDQYIKSKKKYAWINTDYIKAGYNIKFDYPIYCSFNKIVVVSLQAEINFLKACSTIKKKLPTVVINDIVDKEILLKQANLVPKINFDKSKINIVSVGRLAKAKGFELSIGACEILVRKGFAINWYIVGEGSERQKLEQLCLGKGLVENIFFLGADSNPYPYMKQADIYVQTSLFEGLGLTVIEASYLNKPIVSTNYPTVYSILKNEETGLIVEMNSNIIASNIERIIIDGLLKNTLIENLKLVVNRDKEVTLKKVNDLFS